MMNLFARQHIVDNRKLYVTKSDFLIDDKKLTAIFYALTRAIFKMGFIACQAVVSFAVSRSRNFPEGSTIIQE
jgi:hypothetical protein